MGFVFIICMVGMYLISMYESRNGVKPVSLEVDTKMFKDVVDRQELIIERPDFYKVRPSYFIRIVVYTHLSLFAKRLATPIWSIGSNYWPLLSLALNKRH